MNERSLFLNAIEIHDPAARSAYLDEACADDAALRGQVEALLRSHLAAGQFLEEPVLDQLASAPMAPSSEATVALATDKRDNSDPRQVETSTQAGPCEERVDLPFLAPSTQPGHLGRLGHYHVQSVVGTGGFGMVLKAFDEKLHRIVAIKVLLPTYAVVGSARKRFIREAQSAAAVKNEHVVAIYGVQDEAQPPYLVMELIDGVSLQDKLDKRGPLSLKEILRIGLQAAEGLAAAHKQGLVHRDIKPANILLENGVERVKITDFGLARAVDDASVSQSGTVAGTPMYMSPEQAEGLSVDHRSDLFSLGTVLYAMCTGHPPFRASGTHAVLKRVIDASPRPIREVNSEIPAWLEAIVAKLHAKKAEDRFQTAKEVADVLGQHLAHLQLPQKTPRPAPAFPAPATKGIVQLHPGRAPMTVTARRWVKLAGALLMVGLVGGASITGWKYFLRENNGELPTTSTSILGRWESNFGPVWLEHKPIEAGKPTAVEGYYTPEGDKKGTVIAGFFDPVKGVVRLTVDEPWRNGTSTAELTLSSTGRKLEGTWTNDSGESGIWTLIRMPDGTKTPVNQNLNTFNWVQLFNGKDLTGWETHPEQPGNWAVKDGAITCSGPESYLDTERNDVGDVHLRVEMKINASGDSGVIVRAQRGTSMLGPSGMRPHGYEANVKGKFDPLSDFNTGSLFWSGPLATVKQESIRPNEWFTLEMIVRGSHIRVVIDGKVVADVDDPKLRPVTGRIALQHHDPATSVHFRKIEIKLPPPEKR